MTGRKCGYVLHQCCGYILHLHCGFMGGLMLFFSKWFYKATFPSYECEARNWMIGHKCGYVTLSLWFYVWVYTVVLYFNKSISRVQQAVKTRPIISGIHMFCVLSLVVSSSGYMRSWYFEQNCE